MLGPCKGIAKAFQQGKCCSSLAQRPAACTHGPLLAVLLQGSVTPDKCVVCPAHGTAFDLKTGEVKGEWCPKVRVVCAVTQQPQPPWRCRWHCRLPLAELTAAGLAKSHKHPLAPAQLMEGMMLNLLPCCVYALSQQFPNLPLVGKLNTAKPLPVYESRVTEAGDIEVLV